MWLRWVVRGLDGYIIFSCWNTVLSFFATIQPIHCLPTSQSFALPRTPVETFDVLLVAVSLPVMPFHGIPLIACGQPLSTAPSQSEQDPMQQRRRMRLTSCSMDPIATYALCTCSRWGVSSRLSSSSFHYIVSYPNLQSFDIHNIPPPSKPKHQTPPPPRISNPGPKLIPRHIPPHKRLDLFIRHPGTTKGNHRVLLFFPPFVDVVV